MKRPFRLHVVSDLHLDVSRLETLPIVPDVDAIVVAGDVTSRSSTEAVVELDRLFRGVKVPVLYVLGNHEFHGGDWDETIAEARTASARSDKVVLLENDQFVVERDGRRLRVLGCTLWTDLALDGPECAKYLSDFAGRLVADFTSVTRGSRDLRPIDSLRRHRRSRAWLERALAERFDGPTVVVTHHGVGRGSVPPEYEHSRFNALFNSDLTEFIRRYRPSEWVHGHVHSSFDYIVAGTRIVANPRGIGAENPRFRPDLVLELPLGEEMS